MEIIYVTKNDTNLILETKGIVEEKDALINYYINICNQLRDNLLNNKSNKRINQYIKCIDNKSFSVFDYFKFEINVPNNIRKQYKNKKENIKFFYDYKKYLNNIDINVSYFKIENLELIIRKYASNELLLYKSDGGLFKYNYSFSGTRCSFSLSIRLDYAGYKNFGFFCAGKKYQSVYDLNELFEML